MQLLLAGLAEQSQVLVTNLYLNLCKLSKNTLSSILSSLPKTQQAKPLASQAAAALLRISANGIRCLTYLLLYMFMFWLSWTDTQLSRSVFADSLFPDRHIHLCATLYNVLNIFLVCQSHYSGLPLFLGSSCFFYCRVALEENCLQEMSFEKSEMLDGTHWSWHQSALPMSRSDVQDMMSKRLSIADLNPSPWASW